MEYQEYIEKGETCSHCGLALDVNSNCYSQTCKNNVAMVSIMKTLNKI